jgi:hypothetical protein
MAVSEQTIQEAFQDALQTLKNFSESDVTINSWAFVDQSTQAGPYVVIVTADHFRAKQDTQTATNNYDIPFELWVAVDASSDAVTLNNFRDHRQAILDACAGTVRSAGGQAGVNITEVRNETNITPWFDPSVPSDQLAYASPLFLFQRMVLVVEEF